ncbi:MAG TPA: flagellar export chaperone FliS [Syntrophorhabdaceae bacterium]|nr:flagellar export chaperone FliS [Syntrophorhabdaceae bacterium]
MTLNGIKSYKNTANITSEEDKGQLLLKVFQRILEKLDLAGSYIESKNFEKRYEELSQIRQVLEILYDCVDTQYGEISQNLKNLYLYIIKRLDEANVKNDINAVMECKSLIKTIYEGFDEAYKKEISAGKKNPISSDILSVDLKNKEMPNLNSTVSTPTAGGYRSYL